MYVFRKEKKNYFVAEKSLNTNIMYVYKVRLPTSDMWWLCLHIMNENVRKKEFKQQKLFSDLSLKVNNFHECILATVAFSYKFI